MAGQVTEEGLLSRSARNSRRTLRNPDWLKLIKTSLGTKRSQGEKLKNRDHKIYSQSFSKFRVRWDCQQLIFRSSKRNVQMALSCGTK